MANSGGIIWRNKDLNDLRTELGARGAGGREVVDEILEEAGQFGRDKMVEYIETRGTGWQGHRGRIESGKMDDSVGWTMLPREGAKGGVRVGWINPADREQYFLYQEYGFTQPSGHDVPPMHALTDAFVETREKVRKDINDAIKAGKI